MKQKHLIIIISAALVFASLVFYFSAKSFSKQGSYIEVKGLSEKIVKSDIAVWSINFAVQSNDIDSLYKKVEQNIDILTSFLTDAGFKKEEVNVAPINLYQNSYRDALYKYETTVTVSVYTDQVNLVRSTSEKTRSLIKKGVVLTGNYIDFRFTDLDSIKPEMLAEATQKAKVSAEEFAKNSKSHVGKIVRANQGVFSINQKDPGSPEYKKVRVVSTLRFLLK